MKNEMLHYNNSLRTRRLFLVFLFLSFLFWVLPFVLRLFLINEVKIEDDTDVKGLKVVSDITECLLKNDRWSAFCLIFSNNLKVCIVNIAGGAMFGIVTLINLVVNGFITADTFATIHNNGMEVSKILKYTLPHSFELIGIWLSGAIGFYIAKVVFDYMKGTELPTSHSFKFIGKCFICVVIIILVAAFIEAYVSIPYK